MSAMCATSRRSHAMQQTLLLSLSAEEFDARIERAVAAGVAIALREMKQASPAGLLTRTQLATTLQISPHMVSKLAKRGLPCVAVGADRRFRLQAVETWL